MDTDTKEIEKRFARLANELHNQFPDLDLRFNRSSQSKQARLLLGEHNKVLVELDLSDSINKSIWEATFAVKQVLNRYDA